MLAIHHHIRQVILGQLLIECRPITNIMWGDTVALIKMAPRPITLVVAEELSPLPPAVEDELRKASTSPSSGEEIVKLSGM